MFSLDIFFKEWVLGLYSRYLCRMTFMYILTFYISKVLHYLRDTYKECILFIA